MAERLDKLRATLHELETELASVETGDPEARRLLEQAVSEMQAALRRGEPIEGPHGDTLVDRLHSTTQEFEADHPTIAGLITRLIDTLGQMGI